MIQIFIYVLLAILLLVACFQDFKRREIDHWLNILIFIIGCFIFLTNFLSSKDPSMIYSFLIILLINGLLSFLFYKGKVFGGGDGNLLFALSPLVISSSIQASLMNLGLLILIIFVSGAAYGLIYILITYFKNFSEVNKKIVKRFKVKKILFMIGIPFLLVIFSLIYNRLFYIGLFLLIYIFLFLSAKIIDEDFMKRKIRGSALYEGDILTKDVLFKGKRFLPNKKGLTIKEAEILKNKVEVEIKDGIPFAPSFLIGIIIYILLNFNIIKLF